MTLVKFWCRNCERGPIYRELSVDSPRSNDVESLYDHGEGEGHVISSTPIDPNKEINTEY